MKVSIEKTEHYALFILTTESLLESNHSELLSLLQKTVEDAKYKYVLFDLNQLSEIPSQVLTLLSEVHQHMITNDGLLLNTHSNVSFIPVFEENQLLLIPSIEEAVEYIYMDQLEKQFLGGDDLED